MILLKLFDLDDPARVLESRRLAPGTLVIGRDPGPGGWALDDPLRLISRAHCTLTLVDGRLAARDLSANGVRLDGDDHFIARDEDTPVAVGQTLRLGRYGVRLEADETDGTIIAAASRPSPAPRLPAAAWTRVGAERAVPQVNDFDAVFSRPVLEAADPTETTALVPTDWGIVEATARPAPEAAHLPDAALLEAFCAGAKLDLSHFVGEDPQAVMRALGEVYRQMVLGLSDLMNERVTVKSAYRMNRTIVRGENNNVLKWAGAQRVAVDLLRPPADGFMRGPESVNECFSDLKKHVLCVMAGLRASVGATLDGLDPAQLKAGEKAGLFGALGSGKDAYRKLHADFAASVASDPDGPVNRAFRNAYEARLRELDGEGGGLEPTRLSA